MAGQNADKRLLFRMMEGNDLLRITEGNALWTSSVKSSEWIFD